MNAHLEYLKKTYEEIAKEEDGLEEERVQKNKALIACKIRIDEKLAAQEDFVQDLQERDELRCRLHALDARRAWAREARLKAAGAYFEAIKKNLSGED